jgi:hypothetical protein
LPSALSGRDDGLDLLSGGNVHADDELGFMPPFRLALFTAAAASAQFTDQLQATTALLGISEERA